MQEAELQREITVEEKREQWDRTIVDYLGSGLTQRAYAQRHGLKHEHISYHYRQWQKRQRQQQETSKGINFIPVQSTKFSTETTVCHDFVVSLQEDIRIHVPSDFNESALSRLLRVLRGASC